MASMVYAVESWILALLGWAWLSFQDMWAPSLLCSYVFFAFMILSTCNVVSSGIAPESVGPRAAYFGAVLGLTLHATCCVLDTLPMPQVGWQAFASPTSEGACTLSRSTQLFFFSDTQFFLLQAGAMMGYLVVQLVVSGAALLDSEQRSLWPGPSWGCGLGVLLCGRFISAFDGMAKGTTREARYLEIFSLPVAEYTFLLYVLMYLLAVLAGLDGMLFPGLAWRKSARYVTMAAVPVFAAFMAYALLAKGMLTPAVCALLLLMIIVAIAGTVEAALLAPPAAPPPPAWYRPPPQAAVPFFPSAPPGQWGPPARQGVGRQLRELRHVIPTPVEMISEKNKGV
jgi:hypothetical protein